MDKKHTQPEILNNNAQTPSSSRNNGRSNPVTRANRILADKFCQVCQDASSGRHYNAYTCDGCAGFFKRSIRAMYDEDAKIRLMGLSQTLLAIERIFGCRAEIKGEDCPVHKSNRNDCKGCRLKKCLRVGMNKDMVQPERGPRKSNLSKFNPNLVSSAPSNSGASSSKNNTKSLVQQESTSSNGLKSSIHNSSPPHGSSPTHFPFHIENLIDVSNSQSSQSSCNSPINPENSGGINSQVKNESSDEPSPPQQGSSSHESSPSQLPFHMESLLLSSSPDSKSPGKCPSHPISQGSDLVPPQIQDDQSLRTPCKSTTPCVRSRSPQTSFRAPKRPCRERPSEASNPKTKNRSNTPAPNTSGVTAGPSYESGGRMLPPLDVHWEMQNAQSSHWAMQMSSSGSNPYLFNGMLNGQQYYQPNSLSGGVLYNTLYDNRMRIGPPSNMYPYGLLPPQVDLQYLSQSNMMRNRALSDLTMPFVYPNPNPMFY